MVQSRKIFQSVVIEYDGEPTVTVTIDGTEVLESVVLPDHGLTRKTRVILLPHSAIGYTPQLQVAGHDIVRYVFNGTPDTSFFSQQIYHYYEISFIGTVKLKLYLDSTAMLSAGRDETVTLKARGSRNQDTRKIYYPSLSYGYIPHLEQLEITDYSGQVVLVRPVALPPRFFKGIRTHGEIQLTYQGDVSLDVHLDGDRVDSYFFGEDSEGQDRYKTVKEYLPSGTIGNVVQWIQTDGDGEIAVFETDMTLLDMEQPQVATVT